MTSAAATEAEHPTQPLFVSSLSFFVGAWLFTALDDLDFAEGSGELVLDFGGKLALESGIAGNVSAAFEGKGPLRFLEFWRPSIRLHGRRRTSLTELGLGTRLMVANNAPGA